MQVHFHILETMFVLMAILGWNYWLMLCWYSAAEVSEWEARAISINISLPMVENSWPNSSYPPAYLKTLYL